jgi:3-methyladenine DNA glycosylase AlkD
MPTRTALKPAPAAGGAKAGYHQAHAALLDLADPGKAAFLAGFFKTGKGQYAEGDRFLGIPVPAIRRISRQNRQLSLSHVERLLRSAYNEERLLALLVLGDAYRCGNAPTRQAVCRCYLRNRSRVNNWNLVDASAPHILGAHLLRRNRTVLYHLARSSNLWERRIAVLATFAFIREGDFADTLELIRRLLNDKHDLMHKACGWMLREIGKRDQTTLEAFLQQHHREMPRTMLRYAIERFAPARRKAYLSGRFSAGLQNAIRRDDKMGET